MPIRFIITVLSIPLLGMSQRSWAEDSSETSPPPVPVTRTQLKQTLEDSKRSTPRLPLPPLTAEEEAKAAKGDWSVVNNGRMRRSYLPPEVTGGGFTRGADPGMSLGYPFQTMLFWIVSRGNNCTYCLGHQESKLTAAGVGEDQIAALDGDWSEFPEAQRAAFALTRKLTFEPHRVGPDDIEQVRRYYNDKQILEIVFVTGNFNAMNRWTGALKIPQEEHRVYLTPTSEPYRDRPSLVGPPLDQTRSESSLACAAPARRPPLESRAEVEAALTAARARTPRLALASESETRAVLPADWPSGPLPEWVRLLANFPKAGAARITMHRGAETKGTLDAKLKAQVAWIAARHDRAWYALGHAKQRLHALGHDDEDIFALDGSWDGFTPAERRAFALARKLTVDPALITDADIAGLRTLYTDKQVAELVHHVTEAAFFDRVTEASGLRLED